ncbi:unnamed protein product [Paramecium sonneborni]|uniref:Uncharacterized protein n=1 Tax=Paramecium sonneborni TaxID=65129 RepID=A0A8S1QAD4_9CILI|nr:unnamed protein product [Paramecium sonneborni]
MINLVKSINCTLSSIGLMDDFRIVKSFKIFITTLRKVNTDLGKIIYTQEEELLLFRFSFFHAFFYNQEEKLLYVEINCQSSQQQNSVNYIYVNKRLQMLYQRILFKFWMLNFLIKLRVLLTQLRILQNYYRFLENQSFILIKQRNVLKIQSFDKEVGGREIISVIQYILEHYVKNVRFIMQEETENLFNINKTCIVSLVLIQKTAQSHLLQHQFVIKNVENYNKETRIRAQKPFNKNFINLLMDILYYFYIQQKIFPSITFVDAACNISQSMTNNLDRK